jgi:DNA topoisomerase-1
VLRDFWAAFHAAVDETKDLKIGDVISALDEALSDHLFPPKGDGTDPRLCPSCAKGRLGLKLGRTGAFVGCSNYPECRYTRPLGVPSEEGGAEDSALPRLLGDDPATGLPVSIRKGPYGIYAQLGPKDETAKGEKPKRASLTKAQDPVAMTLEEALALLSLPREIGRHPESGEPILAGIGRYGPYLKHGDRYKNLPPEEDVLKIGMNRAVDLLAADAAKARPSAEPLREVGAHPDGGEPIKVFAGRYGPYVRHGKVMASLPRGVEPEAVTVEKAVEWLAAKAAKSPTKGGRGRSSAKAAPKKAPAKAKAAPKKSAARKGKAAE